MHGLHTDLLEGAGSGVCMYDEFMLGLSLNFAVARDDRRKDN